MASSGSISFRSVCRLSVWELSVSSSLLGALLALRDRTADTFSGLVTEALASVPLLRMIGAAGEVVLDARDRLRVMHR